MMKKNIKKYIFQPQDFIKPPLSPVFISSVIKFDNIFHPVVLYENYLICIFMNINENFSNERKNLRKIKGCTYKITNVSPTMCSSVSNLVPIQCLDMALYFYHKVLSRIFMNFNENRSNA